MKQITISWMPRACTLIISVCISSLSSLFGQTENISSADWLTFNRTFNGDRYSPLKQINTSNVKQLHLLNSFDLGNDVSSLQTDLL